MSIHFAFTMMPKKKLFKKTVLDHDQYEQFRAALKKYEKLEQIRVEFKTGTDIKVTYCPEGYFWIAYKPDENSLSGDCQTNVAGPGFHAAALSLLERVSADMEWKLSVEDETGYFKHKDFDRMRREHFYPWLKYILNLLCEQYVKTDFQICWNMDEYTPKTIKGTVITPIRRFSINEIKKFYDQDTEVFAREFFVWNEKKKDARFYRNSALVEMNTKCYFAFSERSIWDGIENGISLQLLEQALHYDYTIPFPKKEYHLLCKLHGQDSVDLESVVEMEHDCEIGYRRQEIYHEVGQFRYSVYGSCLEKYDSENHTLFYYDDEPGRWHNIRITSFTVPDKNAEFVQTLFLKGNVERVLEFPVAEGKCRLAIYAPSILLKSPEGYSYEMVAQMTLGHQLLLVSQTYCRQDETDSIREWFQSFEGRRKKLTVSEN